MGERKDLPRSLANDSAIMRSPSQIRERPAPPAPMVAQPLQKPSVTKRDPAKK